MSRHIVTLVAVSLLLSPVAAYAAIIDGSFSGTIQPGSDDISGVFNDTPGTDMGGDTVTGTFVYNTALFTGTPSGTTEQYNGTGLGALTVTLTIDGVSHTFTDGANSGVYFDSSGTSEVTYTSDAKSPDNDTFSLDVVAPSVPFVTSTSLNQSFSTSNPDNSLGSFVINDGSLKANGTFELGTLSQGAASTAAPEPASMAMLGVGLAGIAAIRRRRVSTR